MPTRMLDFPSFAGCLPCASALIRCLLVLARHQDDGALGCGGTVYKHHLAGDRVTAVYMTDGSQGHEMARGLREMRWSRRGSARRGMRGRPWG
jgi:LmbE family N-acetylglucosaminyl deacetylase